jgi:RimJ/RimL family protein N-acetyltransferase
VCAWATAELGETPLRAKTLAGNVASQRVLLAAGFVPDGEEGLLRFFVRR